MARRVLQIVLHPIKVNRERQRQRRPRGPISNSRMFSVPAAPIRRANPVFEVALHLWCDCAFSGDCLVDGNHRHQHLPSDATLVSARNCQRIIPCGWGSRWENGIQVLLVSPRIQVWGQPVQFETLPIGTSLHPIIAQNAKISRCNFGDAVQVKHVANHGSASSRQRCPLVSLPPSVSIIGRRGVILRPYTAQAPLGRHGVRASTSNSFETIAISSCAEAIVSGVSPESSS